MIETPRQMPAENLVLISVNPHAGARSGKTRVDQLVALLQPRGYTAEVVTAAEELVERATFAWSQGNLKCVVAAGGDGTAAFVVNRLPPCIPITPLPLGTENLLAKYLHIGSPQEAADTIAQGEEVQVDAGSANGRLFLLMVSCGLDADVVRRLHKNRKGHIRHWSYAKPIWDAVRRYQYPALRVFCDDSSEPIVARWAFIHNLPPYARGLRFAPEANGTDGLLDICTFRSGSIFSGLRYLTGVVLRRHRTWRDCVIATARKIRIEAEGEVPFQLDGDPGGMLPVEIEILPLRLTLLARRGILSAPTISTAKEQA